MEWIRKVSLAQRVLIGFGMMAGLSLLLGAMALWSLAPPAAMAGVALSSFVLSLLAGWIIRSSIKESVESTVQCVIRIAGGDLETKIESPGKDEISWLRAELNSMRKKLRKMVLEVR
jgi:methyl-accepting chemotaxis protein